VPLRAVQTFAGAGTRLLPEEAADRLGFARLKAMSLDAQVNLSTEAWNRKIVCKFEDTDMSKTHSELRTPPGWALLMKGSRWYVPDGTKCHALGALHRSPMASSRRVLLQVDYADHVSAPMENPSLTTTNQGWLHALVEPLATGIVSEAAEAMGCLLRMRS